MEILQTKLPGGITVVQALAIAIALIAGYLVLKAVTKKPVAQDTLRARMTCGVCGWTGMVSKHKSRCSSCGSTTVLPAPPEPPRGGRR